MVRKLIFAVALLTSSAAHAQWKEARSKNFIVYSEGSETSLRKAVTDLEKYVFMLRFVSSTTKAGSPVPLKIYLLRTMSEVGQSMGPGGGGGVAGYYSASSRGPIAVGTRFGTGGDNELSAQTILFHEYAHHFMYQHFSAVYPSWYSEGFAEYYGTSRILENDVIEVGQPANHRYSSFYDNEWLPLDRMLTAKTYADVPPGQMHLLYAQGWLLVHYLAHTKERRGQLEKYLAAINRGGDYRQAMEDAFGPGARALNSELRAYSRRKQLFALSLPFKTIDVGPITLRTLSGAQDAMVEQEIALGRGLQVREARALAENARRVAGKYPDSAHAFAMLTEAEYAHGDKAAASAAADKWLALDPRAPRARMFKGQIAIDSLAAARSGDGSAWTAARAPILDANKAAPRDPMILEAYYDSFTAEGVLPPASAQNALYRAVELVPQDTDLRMKLAADYEVRGMVPEAIAIIKPVAFQSHDRSGESEKDKQKRERLEEKYREVGEVTGAETPREMLQRLEGKLAKAG